MRRLIGIALVVVVAMAWVSLAMAADKPSKIRAGGDFRLREEHFDNIPIIADPPGVTRGGENDYFRFRTRLWAEGDPMENVTLRARVANEFRYWNRPDMDDKPQRSSWDFPDEWVFDNLYLDVRDLLDKKLDLRIGRQDMIYGTGKVILEGTPKDGSRTIYFNAAKAVWKGIKDTSVDVFGIYNKSLDELAINDADRDLTGKTSANDDITESGGGVYVKNHTMKVMPWEAYYIYKNESDWETSKSVQKTDPVTGLPVVDEAGAAVMETVVTPVDELKVNTAGFRVMPEFGKSLSGSLEAAYQLGDQGDIDVSGMMVDALVTLRVGSENLNPSIAAGLYYLSGDDPSTADDNEGWNPLWARYPQYSELYVFAWDAEAAGRWSNLMMPHLDLSLTPARWLKTTAMVAYLGANEDNGPGDGKERGMLYTVKGEFTIAEKLLTSKDKLAGHLWLEVLEPGDYYKVDDTAYFARWELSYAF